MNRNYETTTCGTCPHTGQICLQGHELLTRLSHAIAAAGHALEDDFQMNGTACVQGCGKTCQLIWRGERGAAWLFGDVGEGADMDQLIAAQQAGYRATGAVIATRMAQAHARI